MLEDAQQKLQAPVADDELTVVLEPHLRLDVDRGQRDRVRCAGSGNLALRSARPLHELNHIAVRRASGGSRVCVDADILTASTPVVTLALAVSAETSAGNITSIGKTAC